MSRAAAFFLGLGACWVGVALQLQQAVLWPRPHLLACALGAGLAAWFGWALCASKPDGVAPMPRKLWRGWGALAWCCSIGVLAFASTAWRAHARMDERLPKALEGVDLRVHGTVVDLPHVGPTGVRFLFEVDGAAPPKLPGLISLSWNTEWAGDALLQAAPVPVRAGQQWAFTVRLRQAHGAANPHGFDAELWLFERQVGAVGQVRSRVGDAAQLLSERGGAPLQAWRQLVRERIQVHVDDAALAGVISALAVGDQGAIDRANWDLFRTTGVAHLMSISGLHVTLFAWLAGGLLAALWSRHPRAPLLWPAPLAGRWLGLLAAGAYALASGWGVPAQRTFWMLLATATLRTAGLHWPAHGILLAAGTVVLVFDPWALLQPGFWLSFCAVALLVLAQEHGGEAQGLKADSQPASPEEPAHTGRFARKAWSGLRSTGSQAFRTQAVATVGLAPLSLLFFQQVSVVGFLANLVAIPVVTFLITPLALLGALLPAAWWGAAQALQVLVQGLELLAALPFSQWLTPAAPAWALAAGLLAAVVAVVPMPWHLRSLALPLLLPMLWPAVPRPQWGEVQVLAADIGQGNAVLVRTATHELLYDTGPTWGLDDNAGRRLLLPLMQALGVRRLDMLMLSHRDADHVGGAAAVLQAVPVAQLASSLEDGHPLLGLPVAYGPGTQVPSQAKAQARPSKPALKLSRCHAGQHWQWDGVHFEVLHPLPSDYTSAPSSNALSCVLKLRTSSGHSVLLTGDIEAAQEQALLQRAAPLASQVLLAPHHGSLTSSTPEFLRAVNPNTAVFQAGYRSRYGHPAGKVVERYEAQGIGVVRTDQCGAWHWRSTQQAQCWRYTHRRYWHWQPG